MRNDILKGMLAAAITLAAAVFVTTLVHAVAYSPDAEISPPPSLPIVSSTASKPARLQIPALSIDAKVQYAGINAKGAMTVPSNFTDVAWYKYGPVPGQLGSAVIDGHVDNGLGLAGVFKHLGDLQKGDDVYVIADDGTRLHFVVDEIEQYPYSNSPADRIFGGEGLARLNLITCAGTWVKGRETYSDRLVVYTKYVDSKAPSGT